MRSKPKVWQKNTFMRSKPKVWQKNTFMRNSVAKNTLLCEKVCQKYTFYAK
jgi:hypothetical protein